MSKANQISKINNCRLENIGALKNRLYFGSCFATDEHIGLCFDLDEPSLCRLGTDPLGNFETIERTSYNHYAMGWMSADKSKKYSNDSILIKYHNLN